MEASSKTKDCSVVQALGKPGCQLPVETHKFDFRYGIRWHYLLDIEGLLMEETEFPEVKALFTMHFQATQ